MRKTKRVLFTFSPYLYKGVEQFLNEQAAQGWELVKVGTVFAKFRRTERTDLRYCADLLTYRRRDEGRERQREYLALCREGGWELVDRRGAMGLFASRPGTDPAPIQTDPDTERYCYKRAYRNSLFWPVAAVLSSALCLLLVVLLAGGLETGEAYLVRIIRFTWQKSWIAAAWQTALPVLFAAGLWKMGDFVWNWVRTRRTGAIQVPSRRAMWANAVVNLLVFAALLLMIAGGVADIIQGGGSVASFVGSGMGGAIVFFWPSFTYQDEVYPKEYRRARIYGASVVVIAVLLIGATWLHGDDTVRFWPVNDDFPTYYAMLEEEPIVRESDYGQQMEGAYTLRQGIGPAGQYTILMNDLNQEMNHPSCSRYDCYTGWLAKLTIDTLKREAEAGGTRTARVGDDLWTIWSYAPTQLERVELSWADEAWYGIWTTNDAVQSEGRQGTVLIIRAGRTAVRICAWTDLLDKTVQQAIRARLGF